MRPTPRPGTSTTPTTGADGSTGTGATQDAGTTSDTDETTGGPPTTGAGSTTAETTSGDPELMQLCEDYCAKYGECNQVDVTGCAEECVQLGDGSGCSNAVLTTFACLLDVTCEEFAAFTNGEGAGPCAEEAAATDAACGNCNTGVSGDGEGTECMYIDNCPGEPTKEFTCGVDTCTCLEDGVEIGTCPSDGVCMDFEGLPDKAMVCCGF